MRRIVPVLQLALLVAIALVGYAAFHPSAPAAAAYPTALGSYDAPTAWTAQCQWSQHCTGSACYVIQDPNEGCVPRPTYPHCFGCFI